MWQRESAIINKNGLRKKKCVKNTFENSEKKKKHLEAKKCINK